MDPESPQLMHQDDSSSPERPRRRNSSSSISRHSSVSDKEKRGRRGSSSQHSVSNEKLNDDQQAKKKKVFDFLVFLASDQVDTLFQQTNDNFQMLYDKTKVSKIIYDPSIQIPDMTGKCLSIQDNSIDIKQKATQKILKIIVEGQKSKSSSIEVIILIPESMVSLLIGKQGRQINKIMEESQCKVVANQPITGMNQRTIGIIGNYNNVSRAIYIIYQIMQERSAIVYQMEKTPQQVAVESLVVKARMIISQNLKWYLLNNKGKTGKNFISLMDKRMVTQTQFSCERHPYLTREDVICTIEGKLEPVQKSICALFRKVNEYYVQERSKPDYKIKILIPYNYVTKLIGKEGCMIRDLAAKSGGAQIKILSDKGSDRNYHECPIEVAGTLNNKQDACCLIFEKIEQFKNGGPILKTAKSINDNLVEQYKNSIQETCVQHDQRFKNQLKELEEDFNRSSSRSSHNIPTNRHSRKYSNNQHHNSPKRTYSNDYYKSRSRSRSREQIRKEIMDRDRERMIDRDQGRRTGGEREREKDRERDHRYSRDDRYHDRERGMGMHDRYMEDRPHYRDRNDRDSKNNNNSHYHRGHSPESPRRHPSGRDIRRWDQEEMNLRLKIPEKRIVLHGNIDQNTAAFKKIQAEYLIISEH